MQSKPKSHPKDRGLNIKMTSVCTKYFMIKLILDVFSYVFFGCIFFEFDMFASYSRFVRDAYNV